MTERRRFDPAELVREVQPGWDAARAERALDVHLRARRRRRFARVVGASAAAAAVVLLAWGLWPAPVPVAVRPAPSPPVDARVVELADGSRFVPVDGGALTMLEVTETRVRAALTAGTVEVDIVPRPGREVRIEVGAVTVTVLGTAFRITRHDLPVDGAAEPGERTLEVEVAVRRGLVAVDYLGDDGGAMRTVLGAGESGRFPPRVASEAAAPAAELERTPPRRAPSEAEAEAHAAEPVVPATDPAPSWRELAERGAFDEAYAALDAADAPRDLEGLLLAADAARLSGHPREALTFLERAEADAAGDPRAPLAAFSSGRILAQLGRHPDAAAAFERVLALEPGGSLAEDAMVRAAEAHDRAGHPGAAHALAERYLEAYPEGRGAARMRALMR